MHVVHETVVQIPVMPANVPNTTTDWALVVVISAATALVTAVIWQWVSEFFRKRQQKEEKERFRSELADKLVEYLAVLMRRTEELREKLVLARDMGKQALERVAKEHSPESLSEALVPLKDTHRTIPALLECYPLWSDLVMKYSEVITQYQDVQDAASTGVLQPDDSRLTTWIHEASIVLTESRLVQRETRPYCSQEAVNRLGLGQERGS